MTAPRRLRHLGPFSDLVDEAARQSRSWPDPPPDKDLRSAIRESLGFSEDDTAPADIRCEAVWQADGLVGEAVSWSAGFGPRSRAWVLRPESARGPLPGVVALHCHSGIKFYGKEKIADGPDPATAVVRRLRRAIYGGRAFANELARRGFVVLVHDVFLWGSRRFPVEAMPERLRATVADDAAEDVSYDETARGHEEVVEKYCTALGTSLAGIVAHEDRAALAYLRSRADVLADRVGCVGLSGGGCRAALLQATAEQLAATVVVGMMSTRVALLDHLVDAHTWMFFPPGLARLCDWPGLAASRSPSPLLVQYCRDDPLFDLEGMRAADRFIAGRYAADEHPERYLGRFWEGGHRFDLPMQQEAFAWLGNELGRPEPGRPEPA